MHRIGAIIVFAFTLLACNKVEFEDYSLITFKNGKDFQILINLDKSNIGIYLYPGMADTLRPHDVGNVHILGDTYTVLRVGTWDTVYKGEVHINNVIK